MKRLIMFFKKASKIKQILTYLYRGLVVAKAAFDAGFAALKKEKPEDKVYEKLEGITDYLDVAITAVATILGWFGVDTEKVASEAMKEVKSGKKKGNPALDKVTNDLKELL